MSRYIKYVKRLLAVRAAGENCVLATASEENANQFVLVLCNAIGKGSGAVGLLVFVMYDRCTQTTCFLLQ